MPVRLAGPALLLVLGLAGCSLGKTAAATPCHSDAVRTSPGLLLFLASGQTYQVFATDNRISMGWLPLDRLKVCPIGGAAVEITNLSSKAEHVRALQILNLPWYIRTQSGS